MNSTTNPIKIVLVGDSKSGKTTLLKSYVYRKKLQNRYHPTIVDNFTFDVHVHHDKFSVDIWDTSGSKNLPHSGLRTLTFTGSNIFLLCFCVYSRTSFDNTSNWINEIRLKCPETHVLLVGMQMDERKSSDLNDSQKYISFKEGKKKSKEIGACGYFETSSKTHQGVKELFQFAIQIGSQIRLPPYLPPCPIPPYVSFHSTYSDDMKRILTKNEDSDVIISVIGESQQGDPIVYQKFYAHQFILRCSSPYFDSKFETFYNFQNSEKCEQELKMEDDIISQWEKNENEQILITFNKEISSKCFQTILNFWYTGIVSGIFEGMWDFVRKFRDNVKKVSSMMGCEELVEICDNLEKRKSYLNESIISLYQDRYSSKMKPFIKKLNSEYYYKLKTLTSTTIITKTENSSSTTSSSPSSSSPSSIYENDSHKTKIQKYGWFKVEDQIFGVHKFIIEERCPILKTMINWNERELHNRLNVMEIDKSDSLDENEKENENEERLLSSKNKDDLLVVINHVKADDFAYLIEYLYCDQCPDLNERDCTSLLTLAHEFHIPQLFSLCQFYLSLLVEKSSVSKKKKKKIEDDDEMKVEVDLIRLLEFSRIYEAVDLEKVCIYYLSRNYEMYFGTQYSLNNNNQNLLQPSQVCEYSNELERKGKVEEVLEGDEREIQLQLIDQETYEIIKGSKWPPTAYEKEYNQWKKECFYKYEQPIEMNNNNINNNNNNGDVVDEHRNSNQFVSENTENKSCIIM